MQQANVLYISSDPKCYKRETKTVMDYTFPDDQGVHPITERYAAECGYSIDTFPLPGHIEFRASYFSCHEYNQDDQVFHFKFNLVATTDKGQVVRYDIEKTCSPSLPWSPKEVTCETNYMEASVRSDMTCPSGTKKVDWNTSLTTAYLSAISDWQVMFQGKGELAPMTLTEAREQGYVFDVTDGRLIFRTPYGQPHSFTTMVGGVTMEVVHPTAFSRQNWIVLIVDLVAACSIDEGYYDGSNLVWETPEVPSPLVFGLSSLENQQINVGVNGQLLEQPVAEERGYHVVMHNGAIRISIPYNAEGTYRKSFVTDNQYQEFFVFHLYFEQLLVDENSVETRLRIYRPIATPLLSHPVLAVNRTVIEERVFTVYLGDFPEDVELVAVKLNGHDFAVPFVNESAYTISRVPQANATHGYTLRVPFDDPVVSMELFNNGVLQFTLNINYTLTVLPEDELYCHLTSVVAQITAVFPPAFQAICSEQGIRFKLDHQPFDYLWEIYIGRDPLTPELAAQLGYMMQNNSETLLLDVPIFSPGYTYEEIGLKAFFATFEILIKHRRTLTVHGSAVKTCRFPTTELIVCSHDGKMTAVADVSLAMPDGVPSRTSLLDPNCGPKDTDYSKALFSCQLNTCGTRVKLGKGHIVYENEIVVGRKLPAASRNDTDKVTLQCVYRLSGLHRLFSMHKFVSDMPGVGSIVHSKHSVQSQRTTLPPTTKHTTTEPTATSQKPTIKQPVFQSAAHYVKVFDVLKDLSDTLSWQTRKRSFRS
ncbi:uncharacterized protein LOC130130489 [Lampris incognitus]|uniref:uncharacterized protein LOC130130489 n=1 Tax=Lampris incognitus TaxID=2546036 RepID=UPI0024B62202|nr:uncharacterized protein LOC130130489 [Lampris incognitus]